MHRSYIINLRRVDALTDANTFVILGPHSLPVSRSHREGLLNSLNLI
ncbi:MAG: hypothetical protein HC821_03225 [Lewinella sp.]|nr:hypothetical protein [Lewinella sp.]